MMGIGTAINVVAVLVGGGIGTLLGANFLVFDTTSTQLMPTLTLVAVQ